MKKQLFILSLVACMATGIVAQTDRSCCKRQSCAPTPISKPTTITQSGCYCLTQDICGQITIAADNVTLDLNCHEVNGNGADSAMAADGHYNVTVKNGTVSNFLVIKNRGVGVAPNRCGVAISNGVDIELHDLNVVSTDPVGMALTNCVGLNISGCDFSNNNQALQLVGCRNGKIACCAAYDNVNENFELAASAIVSCEFCDCIEFVEVDVCNNLKNIELPGPDQQGLCTVFFSSNVSFERCKVSSNDSPVDMQCLLFEFSQGCTVNDCQVNNNLVEESGSLVGIQALLSPNCVIRKTQLNNNENRGSEGFTSFTGIAYTASQNGVSEECQVNNNTAERSVFGISSVAGDDIAMKNCQANGNLASEQVVGFNVLFSNGVQIIKCQANNNTAEAEAIGILCFIISENVIINGCQANNNVAQGSFDVEFLGAHGIVIQDDGLNYTIENCEANNNSCVEKFAFGIGVVPFGPPGSPFISASNNIRIVNCVTNGNNSVNDEAFGILLDGEKGTNSPEGAAQNVVIKCCQAYDTVSSSTITGHLAAGIAARNGANDVSIQDCQVYDSRANGNGDAAGISIADTLRCTIEGSEANNSTAANGTGSGIVLSGTTDNSTVRDSSVIGNQTNGFADFGIPNNFFAGNYAENNGILDYNGVTAVAVDFDKSAGTFSVTPNRWSNIRALP